MRRTTVALATTALALTGTLAGAGPAQASFPGTNGLIAYVNGGQLFLLNPAISPPVTQQITTAGGFVAVNYDATGKQLVAETNAAGLDGIVFLEPKSESAVTPLAGGNTADGSPAFDPTGTKVTFDNAGDIFVQNVDGSGRTNLTTATADSITEPDWSADGQFIAAQNNTSDQIVKISVADGTITTLTPPAANCVAANPCQEPSISPDNQRVAYDRDPNGIFETLSSGAATAVTQMSNQDDDLATYSPQGDQIVFQGALPGVRMTIVPSNGSMTRTQVGEFVTGRTSWGIEPPPPPPPPPPSNLFTLGALTRNTDKGTATQTVTVPGPGQLVVGGTGVVPQRPSSKRLPVTAAGDVLIVIRARGEAKERLKERGKVKVTASFTFTPTGGTANTLTRKIKLKKT